MFLSLETQTNILTIFQGFHQQEGTDSNGVWKIHAGEGRSEWTLSLSKVTGEHWFLQFEKQLHFNQDQIPKTLSALTSAHMVQSPSLANFLLKNLLLQLFVY